MSFSEYRNSQEAKDRRNNQLSDEIKASIKATAENIKNRNRRRFGKIIGGAIRSGGFRYPLEALTETTDYLQFTIVEYQPTKQASGGSLVGAPGSRRSWANIRNKR